jgi:hypothetical protein
MHLSPTTRAAPTLLFEVRRCAHIQLWCCASQFTQEALVGYADQIERRGALLVGSSSEAAPSQVMCSE